MRLSLVLNGVLIPSLNVPLIVTFLIVIADTFFAFPLNVIAASPEISPNLKHNGDMLDCCGLAEPAIKLTSSGNVTQISTSCAEHSVNRSTFIVNKISGP